MNALIRQAEIDGAREASFLEQNPTFDASDFRAASMRDPEYAEAYMREIRRENTRQDQLLKDRRQFAGIGDTIPETSEPPSQQELWDRAVRSVDAKRAFRASPEGRLLTFIERMEEQNLPYRIAGLIDDIRAARRRGFDGERAFILKKLSELRAITKAADAETVGVMVEVEAA